MRTALIIVIVFLACAVCHPSLQARSYPNDGAITLSWRIDR